MCTGARSCPLGLLGCNLSFIHYQRVASFSLTASFSARRVQSSDVAPPPAALPVKSSPNYPKALKPAKTGPFPAPYSPDLPRACASAYPQIAPRPRLEAKAYSLSQSTGQGAKPRGGKVCSRRTVLSCNVCNRWSHWCRWYYWDHAESQGRCVAVWRLRSCVAGGCGWSEAAQVRAV